MFPDQIQDIRGAFQIATKVSLKALPVEVVIGTRRWNQESTRLALSGETNDFAVDGFRAARADEAAANRDYRSRQRFDVNRKLRKPLLKIQLAS